MTIDLSNNPCAPTVVLSCHKNYGTDVKLFGHQCRIRMKNALLQKITDYIEKEAVKYFHCTGCGQYYKYTTEVTTLSLVALNVRKAFNVLEFITFQNLTISTHLFFNF